MATNTHDTKTLNTLLATVVDSIDGFEQATKSVETSRFKSIFEEVVRDRRGLKGEIEAKIREAGGTPEDEGTMLPLAPAPPGLLHAAYIPLPPAVLRVGPRPFRRGGAALDNRCGADPGRQKRPATTNRRRRSRPREAGATSGE